MKKVIMITLAWLILTGSGCINKTRPELSAELACDLEVYCAETEGSKLKALFKAALQTQIRGSLPDLCKEHYEDWGFDYRAPLPERCK